MSPDIMEYRTISDKDLIVMLAKAVIKRLIEILPL